METHFTVDGDPVTEARYLVYTRDDINKEFTKPLVLIWHDGDWHYPGSSIRYAPPIYAWAGPLLFGRCDELFPPTPDRAPNAPQSNRYATVKVERPPDMRGTTLFERMSDVACKAANPPLEYDL